MRAPLVATALLSMGLVLLQHVPVRGAGTDPTLLLADGDAFRSSTGVAAVRVSGTFSFDDLVQFPFACGLIVFQGNAYARFQLDGTVRSGNSNLVTDGIVAAEIPALLTGGVVPGPPAALVETRSDRLVVTLPQSFGAGPASAVVYAVLDGEPFVSNAITVMLP